MSYGEGVVKLGVPEQYLNLYHMSLSSCIICIPTPRHDLAVGFLFALSRAEVFYSTRNSFLYSWYSVLEMLVIVCLKIID